MTNLARGPLTLHVTAEKWPLKEPFRITGYTMTEIAVIAVTLKQWGYVGRAEAAGVYYRRDDVTRMIEQIESVRAQVEHGLDRQALQSLLPPGGARNALDCALWDLEAKQQQRPAWQVAGLNNSRPLLTTFTCGADDPEKMAIVARSYVGARAIKLKLTGEPIDAERVIAVRAALPGVWLAVDANQGFTRASLERLMPELVRAKVALIEQPFPIDEDALLDGLQSPIPIAADESVQSRAEMPSLVGRVDIVNIKLDKCGGLTEGLAMARLAAELGIKAMVGNMSGTSLAMAPGILLGQLCDVVDLDGPMFLKQDRPMTVRYDDGYISCPRELWG